MLLGSVCCTELSVGMQTEGVDVRSVGNTIVSACA